MNSPDAPSSLVLGDYAVHTAREGFASIVQRSSGEIMHSRTPPMEEAERVYAGQADLADRLRAPEVDEPLVLWDVGLGAAANAMAAIRCYEALATSGLVRAMRIVSFENDLDSLRLACANEERFPYLRHSGPAEVLRCGSWQSADHEGLSWQLVPGDFLETMARAPGRPEVIFYDMFSSKSGAGAWSAETFRLLFSICGRGVSVLCTYTLSTAVRAGMLAAGFWIARGCRVGEKAETTVAFTPAAARQAIGQRHELLGAEWLAKWERSTAKFPADLPIERRDAFERLIRGHEQFAAA